MRVLALTTCCFLTCVLATHAAHAYAKDILVPSKASAIAVRVLAARWHGALPRDEEGAWNPSTAARLVEHLNAATLDLGLAFVLERAEALDVDSEAIARIGESSEAAAQAFAAYQATGRISNRVLTLVVVAPSKTSWVGGWGNQDQPLGLPGSWPMIQISTRIARNKQAHWVAHELGHVMGLYDTTYYETSPRTNRPYTRCDLSIPSTTIPRAGAPLGARQNLMSYDVDERDSFVTDGYRSNRRIIECWLRGGLP